MSKLSLTLCTFSITGLVASLFLTIYLLAIRKTYVIYKEINEENIRKPCLLHEALTDKTYSTANHKL